MLDKQGYMHAHVCTRPRVSARTHARAHTHKYIIFIAFPRQQWFENAPQYSLYIHCLSCSLYYIVLHMVANTTKYSLLFIVIADVTSTRHMDT